MSQPIPAALAEPLQHAAQALDGLQAQPAPQAKQAVGEALARIIAVRNGLLPAGDTQPDLLRRLNAILSMLAGIEYPLGGMHAKRAEQARQALQHLLQGA